MGKGVSVDLVPCMETKQQQSVYQFREIYLTNKASASDLSYLGRERYVISSFVRQCRMLISR